MVRTGFRLILGATKGLTVVGEAANGVEAIDAIARTKPDVVLMDIRMAEMNGIEATQRITAEAGAPRVVILRPLISMSTSTTRCAQGRADSCSRTRRRPTSCVQSRWSPPVNRCWRRRLPAG
ncbi:MAG: response regulator transcription factor [Acidimicrobiales bacterium]|nr:response regulator transcription factor [Acidimicrobiales bacterium]